MQAPASRNAPCPCGSGKRFKDCHGAIGGAATQARDARLDAALALQQAGELRDAARLYAEVLQDDARSFDALHMLAVVRYQQGEFDAAFDLIERALAVQPAAPAALFNRALIVAGLERRPVAEALGREAQTFDASATSRSPSDASVRDGDRTRVIAFYLPQYHRIAENDAWWGEGFTEWSNVRRARPVFAEHWQPHEPGELGYYDLTDSGIRERQAELARMHGVDAFCYYYYWFGGKTLLEQPLQTVLASGHPEFPFCICWANENWTRRWDGLDQEVLIAQRYSRDDAIALVRSLYPFFRDPRYVRVGGKPLWLVYKVGDIPDPAATVELWRRTARDDGIGELYVAAVQRNPVDDATPLGFDAMVEFPPIGHAAENARSVVAAITPDFQGSIFEYRSLAAHYLALPRPATKQFRGVTPMWDNVARRQQDGMVIHGSTPELFAVWLEYVLRQTRLRHHGDERLVFVNAWNEWAEGNHLEPDARHGRRYLESVRSARQVEQEPRPHRPGVAQMRQELASVQRMMDVRHFESAVHSRDRLDVSVIVPVYNHARFLERTLQSIANQTRLPRELIAIDDGSTDDSAAIVESFAAHAPFAVTVVRQANAGAPAALNRGMMMARGSQLALINSDDMFAPLRLERVASALNASTALAFSGTEFIDDDDRPASGRYVGRLRDRIARAPQLPNLLYTLVVENIAISTGNFVFSRSLLDQIGGFAPLAVCHDWDFLMAATYVTRIGFVRDALYRYRLHDANAFSRLRLRGLWESELLLDSFFQEIDAHPWLDAPSRAAFYAHVRAMGLAGYLPTVREPKPARA